MNTKPLAAAVAVLMVILGREMDEKSKAASSRSCTC